MKTIFSLLTLVLLFNLSFAQRKWFTVYSDSTALVKDANEISNQFINDIKKIKPNLEFSPSIVLNTTPYLIYYDNNTVNLPLWEQIIPELKNFTFEVAGSEMNGKKVFGLFFNGFYLPHELAHGFQDIVEGTLKGSYKNEYFANTVAILWWRKSGRNNDLEQCYQYAKKMIPKMKNPTPQSQTTEQYYTEHYREATEDPYYYGFMQFTQFVEIYENKSLPDFNSYIKNYLDKKQPITRVFPKAGLNGFD